MTDEQKDKRIAELEEGLSDRLRRHVEQLANTSMCLSMLDWNTVSNDILEAASLLASAQDSEPDAPRIDAAKLAEIQERHERETEMWKLRTSANFFEPGPRSAVPACHHDRAFLLAMI